MKISKAADVFSQGDKASNIASARVQIYEQSKLREAAGETLHPGGLELTTHLFSQSGLPSGAKILDIGCGFGTSLEWMNSQAHYSGYGIDISTNLLKEAAFRSIPVINAAAETLPFAANTFDGVSLECSLSNMLAGGSISQSKRLESSRLLREIDRVLRLNGNLMISDLYARNPEGIPGLGDLTNLNCLSGLLDLDQLRESLTSSGYEIRLLEDHSCELKELGSRICRIFGSRKQFWETAAIRTDDYFDLILKIGRAKPGYFILVAQKTAPTFTHDIITLR